MACFVDSGLCRVVGIHWVYELYQVCMKLLVHRGTLHKGVVIVRSSNCCHGIKVLVAKMFLGKAT